MSERMTDKRLIEIEHVENEDTRLELHYALTLEREALKSMPCYFVWFWNEEGRVDWTTGRYLECTCPACEIRLSK